MNRRTFFLGGVALTGSAAIASYQFMPSSAKMLLENYSIVPRHIPVLVSTKFDWKGTDFLAGGLQLVDIANLPAPIFREDPNCTTTLANIIGPCDAEDTPYRVDLTEGKPGLPMRISMRVVRSHDCKPYKAAEVEIWHANPKGKYSGENVSVECTLNDPDAVKGLAFRGKQTTDEDGIVNFLTVYPGWYAGRCTHVHIRVLIDERELLVSQLYFEDLLSDIVFNEHPDYAGREMRDTRNENDNWSPRAHLNEHMFDFEKLQGGVLQATYTIGVA